MKLIGLPLLLPLLCSGQILHFGTNEIIPGKIVEFTAPLSASATFAASRLRLQAEAARGALVVPASFDLRKPWSLLIVSAPSGASAIVSLRAYTNVALAEGWVVLAADGPKISAEDDSIQWGWTMLSSVLDQVARNWPTTRQWPVACAGFSGGAKRSGCVAAALMHDHRRVLGIFMGGCNEDRASLGSRLYQPGDAFKSIPIFLSSGSEDPIANPDQTAPVRQSMERSGFKRIRLETYAGGHRLDDGQLRVALRWFKPPLPGNNRSL